MKYPAPIKTLFRQTSKCAGIGMLLAFSTSASYGSFVMHLVGDNDFAVFAGTETSVTSLIYQNGVSWEAQASAIQNFTFNLLPGQNTFYVVGLGGGGPQENISGTVNGVDITAIIDKVQMSSNIGSFLPGYTVDPDTVYVDAVVAGTFNVNMGDVNTALQSGLAWNAPTITTSQTVPQSFVHPNANAGYFFGTNTAHLFKFNILDVGLAPVPEVTSTFTMFGLVAGGLMVRRRGRLSL